MQAWQVEKLAPLPLLLQSEPYVVEALFPLFELLHHYWINQADRDSCLQVRGRWGRVSRPPRGLRGGRIRPPRHHRLPVQWAWPEIRSCAL